MLASNTFIRNWFGMRRRPQSKGNDHAD
jgi:hypothetical protein